MATNGEGRRSSAVERGPNGDGAARDGDQIVQSIARVRDPVLRYLLAQLLDLCTERIEQLETALEEIQRDGTVSASSPGSTPPQRGNA